MNRYHLTPRAAQDLEEIYDYVVAQNFTAAGRLLTRFTDLFVRLSEMPGIGRERGELLSGLRSIAEGSYVTFYRIQSREVEIIRVLHGARDIPAVFRERREEA